MRNNEAGRSEPVSECENIKSKKASRNCEILSYVHDIVYVLPVLLIVTILLFKIVFVSGSSMYGTLIDGDCLFLTSNIISHNYKPGDIVVAAKKSFKDGEPIIKRIIATEGQQVDIDFESGIVYVDGKALDESYTNSPTNLFEGTTFPLTVDENCYLVLGDNRNSSKDSRSDEIGLIDKREILGKAFFLAFPGADNGSRDFHRIGVIKHG